VAREQPGLLPARFANSQSAPHFVETTLAALADKLAQQADLKLESRKKPIELVVIGYAEKIPADN
jgi:uncharacterized protein (TIGR03435 family)